MREVVEPTQDEYGYETHPAWGQITLHRSQVGPKGAVVFDSDIRHHNVITVRLYEASRKRSLNHDSIHEGKVISEIEFSEAQFAAFITSTNTSGVSCTIRYREGGRQMPEMPFVPRMQESMDEVRNAAEHSMQQIREAFEKVKEKPNKGNLRHLEAMIDNAPSNMEFAAKSLTEHAENVVQKSKADIEAMVLARANQLGLDPGEILPALEAGVEVDDAR